MGYYRPGDSAQTQGGLPIDGLTGQFLAKKTDSDFDVEWASVPGAGGSPGAAGYPSVEVPTGFDITGSGTASVVIRFATGYSLPTSAAQQAWSTGAEQAAAATAAVAGLTPALASKADLDASGRVPAAQLPGYVDDVLEFPNFAAFPIPGETGKLYVSLASNRQYRWSGSTYIEINPSPGSTDGIPEGSVNLYFTAARGVAAAASWWDASDAKAKLDGVAITSRAAKTFLSGPTSGSAAPPGFRGLVATDMPVVLYSFRQVITPTANTYTLDALVANEFAASVTISGNITVTLSNLSGIPAGHVWRSVFRFTWSAGAITLAAPAGFTAKTPTSAPTLVAGRTYDLIASAIGGEAIIDYRYAGDGYA